MYFIVDQQVIINPLRTWLCKLIALGILTNTSKALSDNNCSCYFLKSNVISQDPGKSCSNEKGKLRDARQYAILKEIAHPKMEI